IYDKIYQNFVGGVIALSLTACTTDSVFEDIDQQTPTDANTGSQNQTNSFNENDPGNTHGDLSLSGPIWRGRDYYSPWDIWFRTNTYGDQDLQPNYIFSTIYNGEKEGIQNNYKLEVFAYVGLAYFDGFNDGTYTDVATSGPTLQYNLASGNYPNLYAGNNEVGNLIRTATPFIVGPNQSIRVEDREKHLLTNVAGATDKYPMYNIGNQRFVFSGITTQEEELLATYGKVFFYEVFVTDQSTGNVI